jgi:hypothetical protein
VVTRSDRHDRAVVVDGVKCSSSVTPGRAGLDFPQRCFGPSYGSSRLRFAGLGQHRMGCSAGSLRRTSGTCHFRSDRLSEVCYHSCCSRSRVTDTNTSLQDHSIHRSYLADMTGEHNPRSMATGLRTQSSKSTDRPLRRMRRYLFDPPFCDEDTTQGSDGARFSAAHCRANRLSSAAVYRLSLCLIFSQWVSIVFRLR